MLAIILKELRCYCNTRKYRRIQFLTLCALTLLLFIATVEFYASSRLGRSIDVGEQTYAVFITALFFVQFLVPRHAVEAVYAERESMETHGQNGSLLALTPLSSWKILAGKWIAVFIWAMWGIWLTVPLFAFSTYIGGISLSAAVKCGAVLSVNCLFFALIGMAVARIAPPTQAKAISYGVVLLVTFLPFLPSPLFEDTPILKAMSPLSALLSIFYARLTEVWAWNVGLSCILSALIFPVLSRSKY